MSSSDENVKQLDAQTLLEGMQYGITILEKSGSFFKVKHCYTTQQSHCRYLSKKWGFKSVLLQLYFSKMYIKRSFVIYIFLPSHQHCLKKHFLICSKYLGSPATRTVKSMTFNYNYNKYTPSSTVLQISRQDPLIDTLLGQHQHF